MWTRTLKYTIESMVVRRNRIFGFGWVFHPDEEIAALSLELTLGDGRTVRLPVNHGKGREDVATAFPDEPQAWPSGFVIYGGWSGEGISQAHLEVATITGTLFRLEAPFANLASDEAGKLSASRFWQHYRLLLTRGWSLLRRGKPGLLIQKARRYLAGMPQTNTDVAKAIRAELVGAKCGSILLIIDHDLAGGANQYRERLIESRLKAGHGVLLLTYHLISLQYVLEVRTVNQKQRYAINSLDVVVGLVEEWPVDEVFYNNAVSFGRPEDIPDLMVTICRGQGIPLTVAIHDYFIVCPSHFLLDKQGRYCGIPDTTVCGACLPNNGEGFATLFEPADIILWRRKWRACLDVADRILCFSNSSRELLKKAYPSLKDDRIEVCPHTVEHLPSRRPRIDLDKPLHLGVVGSIGIHKGARVIHALAEEIVRRGLDVKISIIGSVELPCDSRIVSETGPYAHEQIVNLIEKTGANLFFFPSICPETFSYVTQELIELDLPVVCFDLGAPAERLRGYSRGRVIPLGEAGDVLDALLAYHRSLSNYQTSVYE